jgi:hypothetical protein
MKKNHQEQLPDAAYDISLDEMAECTIYDAANEQEKAELTEKKERKVFSGQPITVRLMMRNPLLTEIQISKVRLVCSYKDKPEGKEDDSEDFTFETKDYKF